MTEEQTTENPIEDIFKLVKTKTPELSKELFTTQTKETDLKTDVIYPEDVLISTLKLNDKILDQAGINKLYEGFIDDLLRIRFSLDRKSRNEFVQVNTRPLSNMQFPTDFKSISEARK